MATKTSQSFDALASLFGPRWWQPPLFYSHEFALRFELGQGECWIDRMETAKCRARTIMQKVLGDAREFLLVVANSQGGHQCAAEEQEVLAESLAAYCLPMASAYSGRVMPPSNGFDTHTWLGIVRLPRTQIDRVLWAALAKDVVELPVSPSRIYILGDDHSVLCHPYDDRGMDVVSASRSKLQSIYSNFRPWLLDYDIPRMDAVFGK